jgi:hypothetical protein
MYTCPKGHCKYKECADCSYAFKGITGQPIEYHIVSANGNSTCAFVCAKHETHYTKNRTDWIVTPVNSPSKPLVSAANIASYVGPEPVCNKTECVLLFGAGTSINHVKNCKWVVWNEARKAPKVKPKEAAATYGIRTRFSDAFNTSGPPTSGTGTCPNCRDTGWFRFWELRETSKAVCTGGHDVYPCPSCKIRGRWYGTPSGLGRECGDCHYTETVVPIPSSWWKQ